MGFAFSRQGEVVIGMDIGLKNPIWVVRYVLGWEWRRRKEWGLYFVAIIKY